MNRQKYWILLANMGFGPLIGLAVLLCMTVPLSGITALLKADLLAQITLFGTYQIMVVMVGLTYLIGLVPAFLHSCIMMLAMRTGARRQILVLISPASGFIATALFFSCLRLPQGMPFSPERLFMSGFGGTLPAFICMLIAFRWMDRDDGRL